jgi:hypothetical protein
VINATLGKLEGAAAMCLGELGRCETNLRRALVTAKSIEVLDQALNDKVMDLVMKLMGTPLGFMTDKPYDRPIVKRCVIEALLEGVDWTGNQFNIIAGRMYITQAGFDRKVRDLPDVSYPDLSFGVPREDQGRMVIRVGAQWTVAGEVKEFRDAKGEPGIPFVVNSYQGSTADNLIGKAKRKALKLIWERSTGRQLAGQEDEPTPLTDAAVRQADARTKTDQLADKLEKKPDPPGDANEGSAPAGDTMFSDPAAGPYADNR